MNPKLVLTVLASVLVQSWAFKLDGRIVGGENANIKDFPYQASVMLDLNHFCGGSIIGDKIILSAAHCTHNILNAFWSIRVGSTIRDEGGQVYDVLRINNHPNYDPVTVDFDVTVLTTYIKVRWHGRITVQPIGVKVPTGTAATVTGWGRLKQGDPSLPKILQKVVVNTVGYDYCNKAYGGDITPRMLCAAAKGKDACQSDSGGPIVANGVQIGIVSWGQGCAMPGFPGVYSDLSDKDIGGHVAKILSHAYVLLDDIQINVKD